MGASKSSGAFCGKQVIWVESFQGGFVLEPVTFRVESPLQALLVEQALAMAKELESEATAAEDGTVLDVVETIALKRGRELMRAAVEASLQAEAAVVEKKGRRLGYVPLAIIPDAIKEAPRDK